VVGIGNSGADIVTELGMMNGGGMRNGGGEVVNPEERSETLLVARSGGWVARAPHLEVGAGMMAGEAIVGDFINRQPCEFTTRPFCCDSRVEFESRGRV
jgi:hypothetical protein